MSHLVAYIGNEPEHMECALYPARNALHVHSERPADGWRLGFVQGGDVLLQKKPRADARDLDFFALAKDLSADAFVGRVDADADIEGERQDPFRFRWWLGAAACRFAATEELQESLGHSVPAFLRRNMHGSSAGEYLFHLFLSQLHEAGVLELPAPAPEVVYRAARTAVEMVGQLRAAAESSSDQLVLLVTNGRTLIAAARGAPIRFLTIKGLSDCPVCHGKRSAPGNGRRIAHETLRAVVVESTPVPTQRIGWQQVPPSHALLVGTDRSPTLVPLDDFAPAGPLEAAPG